MLDLAAQIIVLCRLSSSLAFDSQPTLYTEREPISVPVNFFFFLIFCVYVKRSRTWNDVFRRTLNARGRLIHHFLSGGRARRKTKQNVISPQGKVILRENCFQGKRRSKI